MAENRHSGLIASGVSSPPETVYNDDSLLFVILRTPKVMMVPMAEGIGCRRLVIPKALHRTILRRIDRSKSNWKVSNPGAQKQSGRRAAGRLWFNQKE